MPDLQKLYELLPHRPPMLMIDELLRSDERSAEARVCFKGKELATNRGEVLEWALIESLAQTVAALQGSIAQKLGSPPGRGMLTGVRDFRFHGLADADALLELSVEIERRLDPFALVRGRVRQGERLIAEGGLNFYVEKGDCTT